MIKKLALFLLLVVVFITTILVSPVALADNPLELRKQTGGGWFIEWYTGNKVTFSFTAQTLEPFTETPSYISAKGEFQLIDHIEKTRIHGTIDYWYCLPDTPWWGDWRGECSIDGIGGYYFLLFAHDKDEPGWPGEWAWILIYENPACTQKYGEYWLDEGRSNIKTH